MCHHRLLYAAIKQEGGATGIDRSSQRSGAGRHRLHTMGRCCFASWRDRRNRPFTCSLHRRMLCLLSEYESMGGRALENKAGDFFRTCSAWVMDAGIVWNAVCMDHAM